MALTQEQLNRILGNQSVVQRAFSENRPTVTNTPRSIVSGTWADILKPIVSNPVGEFVGAADVQRALNSASYNQPLTTGSTLQTGNFRPEYLAAALALTPMGKGAKIAKKTEYEIAHETAERNAALPVSEGGLGLPATNTAMDRAKALGFDTENTWYHGTRNDISAFDRNKIKDRFPQSFGIHITSRPDEANIYADSDKNYLAGWNPISKIAIPVEENANVIPLLTRNTNQLKLQTDYPTASMEADLNTAEIIDKLWEKKKIGKPYESVRIDKIHEKPENSSWGGSNFIAMNPAVLRSPNAAFDPFRRNEADILAGVGAGIPAAGLLDEKKKK